MPEGYCIWWLISQRCNADPYSWAEFYLLNLQVSSLRWNKKKKMPEVVAAAATSWAWRTSCSLTWLRFLHHPEGKVQEKFFWKRSGEKLERNGQREREKRCWTCTFPHFLQLLEDPKDFYLVPSIGEEVKHFFLNTDSSKNLRLQWHSV